MVPLGIDHGDFRKRRAVDAIDGAAAVGGARCDERDASAVAEGERVVELSNT